MSTSSTQTSDYDLVTLDNADLFVGVMSIGGSFAYAQIIWYFRSYPKDPLKFKTLAMKIGIVAFIDSLTLLWTIWELYWMLILRGIGEDPNFFVYCDFWAINVREPRLMATPSCLYSSPGRIDFDFLPIFIFFSF
ncbi:hypothetical protein NP233_g3150 [Leucocoprinus birnbaumii]|uniref:Uncharacterized protein n=1 Tax=Leucocoprinus birnbaumii TaxID=56174 RepID=A0AAD5VX28_9AGAR|nr:hypothetical protein NP233_g3150 [Leucocoprinus birnbaumii]